MTKRIFRSIFFVAFAALLCTAALIVFALYHSFTEQRFSELRNESAYIYSAYAQGGTAALDRVRDNTPTRITLINADGNVTYDSQEEPARMENHADRKEFQEAVADGTGRARRYSDTLSHQTLYYALKLPDGQVLRVSGQQDSILPVLVSVLLPMLAILAAAVIVSFFLASRLSKRIVRPINTIDLAHPDPVYRELAPLVDTIQTQMARIESEHTDRERMRREFTTNVAHELKTPLTSISGFAEIIRDGVAKSDDIQRFAGMIYTEAQRLIVLIGDIIKLSQLDENEIAAAKEPVDLYDAAAATLAHLHSAAARADVRLIQCGEHVLVMGVEQILYEMIYNLCENAIKYNRPGGSVTVETGASPSGAYVSVTDTGIGIPAEDLDRVFERFYRVNKSHSKEVGGTGLGLSIVKHGAAYHGAKIEIRSELGKGTEVKLNFLNGRR